MMRVWGRISATPDASSSGIGMFAIGESAIGAPLPRNVWVAVESVGQDETACRITQLIQVLKLALAESPFYSNYGIPAQRSILQQIMPDYYVNVTQGQFADFFASLTVTKLPPRVNGRVVDENPTYNISIVTNSGTVINQTIAV